MSTSKSKVSLLLTLSVVVLLALSQYAVRTHAQDKPSGEITFFMPIDDARIKWFNEDIIPNFEKDHPEIKLTLLTVPFDQYDPKLVSLAAAGTPPDMFPQWGQSGVGTYNQRGLIRPIDDLIQKWGWDLSGVDPKFQNFYKFNGQTLGIPMYSLGAYIYYNKDLFDKAGVAYPPSSWDDKSWTWDELAARAKKLTLNYDDPQKAQYGFMNIMSDMYGGTLWSYGAQFFDLESLKTGKLSKVNFASPEAIAAIQMRADLINKFKVSPPQSAVDALTTGGNNPLSSGKVAMVLGGGWEMWGFRDVKDLNWGLAAIPRGTKDENAFRTATFSDPVFIHKASKNPDAAFVFVKWLTTGPGSNYIVKGLLSPTVVKTTLPEYYKLFPSIPAKEMEEVYLGSIKYGQENPASLVNGYGKMEDIFKQRLKAVWNGEKSAAEVLPDMDKEMNDAIKDIE